MSSFSAQLSPEKTALQLREPIRGRVTWQSAQTPHSAEIRLFWRTEGKGDLDTAIAEQLIFENPQAADERTFSFVAPIFPPSFSGRLISLVWALELVIDGQSAAGVDLTISGRSGELTFENHPEWITFDGPSQLVTWLKRR